MTNDTDFIRDWMEGKVSPQELDIRKLKGDHTVAQYQEIITKSAELKVPDTQTKAEAWQKLKIKIDEQRSHETKEIKLNPWILVSIAASLTVIVISYVFFFSTTTVSTQMAENLIYVLPDGSEVFLNADSKISYKEILWERNRSITLDGEAFFKVKKGSRFTVISKPATITVLGTSFNVNARLKVAEISCFTGKVKVSREKQDVILTSGKLTRIENDTLIPPAMFDENRVATWRNGEFYFESKPLGIVIDELERQFNVTIDYHGDASRLYTGYFNAKKLDDALSMVFKPMSLNYHKENNKKIVVK